MDATLIVIFSQTYDCLFYALIKLTYTLKNSANSRLNSKNSLKKNLGKTMKKFREGWIPLKALILHERKKK